MRMLCHLQCLLQRIPGGRFIIDRVVGAVVSKKWNDYAWCCFKFMASESVASSEAIVNPSQSLLCQQGSQLSTWRSALNQWPYGLTSMLVHEVTVSVQFKLRERKFTFRRIYLSSRCSLCLKVASLLKSIISTIKQRNGRRLGLRKETTNPSMAGVGKTIHPHNLGRSNCCSRVGFLPSQLENCEKDNQPYD